MDPGFPAGGRAPSRSGGGALTSDVSTFWQKHMQKQKNWIPLGGMQAAPPGSANEVHVIPMAKNLFANKIMQK